MLFHTTQIKLICFNGRRGLQYNPDKSGQWTKTEVKAQSYVSLNELTASYLEELYNMALQLNPSETMVDS